MKLANIVVRALSLSMLGFSGCAGVLSPLAGEWGQLSKDRNDVAAVKTGMRLNEVITKIGKPQQMEEGENIYAGWQQWIYPTGVLLIYRGEVKSVHVKPRTEEVLADLAKANKKGFEFGFESEKESTKRLDAQELAKQNEAIWGVKKQSRQNPYARGKYQDGALEGFSSAKK